jgi:DNA-binding GntR family transcriptional regulator
MQTYKGIEILLLQEKDDFKNMRLNMINRKITSKSTEKIPSYVSIYNMLYADIINGVYGNETLLPSETALTEKYGVSRNTLRQALTVLNEDGLIKKHQGKGTLVTYKKENDIVAVKKVFNPIIQCSKEEIDAINTSYNYGAPTEVAQRKLDIGANEIIMASNNVYFVNQQPVGHSFIQIPVKHINGINIDLNSEDEVSNLINKNIFELADSAVMNIKLVFAEDNITSFLKIQENEPVVYIEEILYNKQSQGIARCKFYFIPDKYEIFLSI